ncbi:hypothetical protein A8C56_14480 [Niabella ginsenosidivorans]|uniref:DUF4149 domain-containing protein n=1 Tax=Niabella ginsenosidivorans TaxID=1176587 RepID=A0A1A9I320_9BACT|nr:hypothetical protein [Niabella ginsenosidivorans]ANH82016.1 hypothetical protein A8C56_14480 [Niabella ginsenosidivorans]
MIVKYPFAVPLVFIWIGFLCAISFMEAWLKFRAPGITVPLGLGIGKIVFTALNKVELVLAIAIGLVIVTAKTPAWSKMNLLFALPLCLLILQKIWLLPSLNARAELAIQGVPQAPSWLHFYFVTCEILKLAGLTTFGISLFVKPT